MGRQRKLLKKSKESDEFFSCIGLSQSNIYQKVRLHKLLCKFAKLNKSALISNYLKSNFKLIKKVCQYVDLFGEKK